MSLEHIYPIKLQSLATEDLQEIVQVDTGCLTIGRDLENDISIESDSISRVHACIFDVDGHWLLKDFGSTNGSWVNGIKVSGSALRLLRSGDVIQLANFPVLFSELVLTDTSRAGERGMSVLGRRPKQSLIIFFGDNFCFDAPLEEQAGFRIGGEESDLQMGESFEQLLAEIVNVGGRFEIRLSVNSSTVPVLLNGTALGGVSALVDRDEIQVGGYRLILNDIETRKVLSPRTSERNMFAALGTQMEVPSVHSKVERAPSQRGKEVEEMKRKFVSGRKYIFGTEVGNNTLQTVSLKSHEAGLHVSEVASSARFSPTSKINRSVPDDQLEVGRLLNGVIIFLCLLLALYYFFFLA